MKILFLPKWYPNENDVQHGIFIKNQALAISKFTEVGVLFVITSDQIEEEKMVEERQGNYYALTFYFPKRSNRLFALYNYYKTFTRARLKMESVWGKPDLIHLYILGRNYMMYKKFYSGIPFVVSEQWSGYLNGGMERYIYAKRKNTLNALKKANQVVAVSKPLANALEKYSGKKNIHIIPNIVHQGTLKENSITDELRILTVADLEDSIKNISGMLDVLKIVSVDYGIYFTIVGEGSDEKKLREKAKSVSTDRLKIEFKKRMPHPVLLEEYSRHHFYFLNSPVETFCVAAAESIACGRPVIATRCGGPEEYLNEKNGYFFSAEVPEGKAKEMLNFIGKLKVNGYPANELSMQMQDKYGADSVAKQYLTVFQSANNKKNH